MVLVLQAHLQLGINAGHAALLLIFDRISPHVPKESQCHLSSTCMLSVIITLLHGGSCRTLSERRHVSHDKTATDSPATTKEGSPVQMRNWPGEAGSPWEEILCHLDANCFLREFHAT